MIDHNATVCAIVLTKMQCVAQWSHEALPFRCFDTRSSKRNAITECIEVKQSDDPVSPSVRHFQKLMPHARFVQIVDELRREKEADGVEIRKAADYLAECAV
jgi:hypothetical protein